MPTTITETATFDAPAGIKVPSDGDAENALSVTAPITGFQALANRTQYLLAATSGLLIGTGRTRSPGDGKIYVAPIAALQLGGALLSMTSEISFAPAGLGANAWNYVYAYNSSGAIAFQNSTTAPDAATGYVFKTGDATRRYLGCFRTNGASTIVPFRADRGRYTYRRSATGFGYSNFYAGGGSATAFSDIALASFVPPHAALATLFVRFATRTGFLDSIELITKGDGAVAVHVDATSALASAEVAFEVDLETDAAQTIQYKVANAGDVASVSVIGFTE